MRNKFAAIAAATLLAGGALATAQTASATSDGPAAAQVHNISSTKTGITPSVSTGYKNFVNEKYGNCLDDSSGYGLRMFPCNNSSYNSGYQKWYVVNNGSYFQFQNVATGSCLDASSYGLRGFPCNSASYDSGYQKWQIYASGSGWVDWGNIATGQCMDYSSDYGLRLFPCNTPSFNSGYQAWNY